METGSEKRRKQYLRGANGKGRGERRRRREEENVCSLGKKRESEEEGGR